MKITFVLHQADLGGGVRVVATYAQRLKDRGHDVLVVSQPWRKKSIRDQLRHLWYRRAIPDTRRIRPSHLDFTDVEHRVLEENRPVTDADLPDADVVIATWWETADWVHHLSPSKGAKAYFVQHYEVAWTRAAERVDATYRLPLHKIVISQWLKDLMRDKFGDTDVSYVPNSVDLEEFTAPPRGKQSVPTVGLMYATIGFKGCDIALKAFELAAQRVPKLRLVAFGKEKPIDRLALPPGTEYIHMPAQELIKQIYAKCDAWLFASRLEGFGLPILEAMACRTPVIGTPAGAAPELLAAGGGILVKPEDPHDMADAIVRVCGMSDSQWRSLSDNAHAVASRYSWEEATDGFEAALRTAIERGTALSLTKPA
jgi:glycosyltransferase involved in cell wall biosynthesis